jgi:hypothetical protein
MPEFDECAAEACLLKGLFCGLEDLSVYTVIVL